MLQGSPGCSDTSPCRDGLFLHCPWNVAPPEINPVINPEINPVINPEINPVINPVINPGTAPGTPPCPAARAGPSGNKPIPAVCSAEDPAVAALHPGLGIWGGRSSPGPECCSDVPEVGAQGPCREELEPWNDAGIGILGSLIFSIPEGDSQAPEIWRNPLKFLASSCSPSSPAWTGET